MKDMKVVGVGLGLALASVLIVGCGGGSSDSSGTAATTSPAATAPTATASAPGAALPPGTLDVQTGAAVSQSQDPKLLTNLVASTANYGHRQDPFALSSSEKAFDQNQLAYRVLNEGGGQSLYYEPPVEAGPQGEEAQPPRRLAGIVVSDAVLAIIDMGDGQPAKIIHPGSQIGEWTVVAIDETSATLHRGGDVAPHDVVVHLQGSLPGQASGTGFGNQGPNGPGGPGGPAGAGGAPGPAGKGRAGGLGGVGAGD